MSGRDKGHMGEGRRREIGMGEPRRGERKGGREEGGSVKGEEDRMGWQGAGKKGDRGLE